MMRHYFTVSRQVEVDECPRCAGFWLDAGELQAIREQFATEEDRGASAQERFSTMFDAQIQAARAESERKAARAQRFAHLFRFILPSYYIPGKQKGGAF